MKSTPDFTCTLSKHHALGNDFLVLDWSQFTGNGQLGSQIYSDSDLSSWARRWCDRRKGLGADGLLILDIVDSTHLMMKLFNADGGAAEMSGNGIRCLVQAAYRKLVTNSSGVASPRRFEVETATGLRVVEVVAAPNVGPNENFGDGSEHFTMQLKVDMGIIEEIFAPVNWADVGCHADRPVRHVSLGNPHSVVGVDDVNSVDLVALGEKIPQVNLEIVAPGPEINGVTMRVHERGAGLTLACGTGACAVADAAMTWGLVPASCDEVIVHMPGGDALVAIDRSTRRATLTGAVIFVATIAVDIPVVT